MIICHDTALFLVSLYCGNFSFMVYLFRNVYLRRVINVEENHDVLNGDRYLIELVSHT